MSAEIPTSTATTTETSTNRKFRRSRDERMIAGLCGGAAKSLGVDPTIARVALIAVTLFGFGSGILLYLACWLVVPEE
ncbi:phage shock protein C (PspC) family protein [Saccharopolyspora kobensis]|uniref:Phage shock protein C (PspC) family protein n=1 Tax=Saccharopolyspora kobensis TaxID=146035 RepID=A0A1H6EJN0_9PSEU|nr:PspC domain-containing protein [Saccharopolyspora kobensis]SEG98062.1 phage shock protein C (PspC) family protein [Saccharopolyspora kobensis]SFE96066.1 phage shock protein C (PspC) family protein [Saccharopolyspora kobensis]